MNRKLLSASAIAAILSLNVATAAVQSESGTDSCCLASEWRLSSQTELADFGPTSNKCEVEVPGLSCCVGSEWKADAIAGASESHSPSAAVQQAQTGPADGFCCIASEWATR